MVEERELNVCPYCLDYYCACMDDPGDDVEKELEESIECPDCGCSFINQECKLCMY